jgi:hypothetical protein
VTRCHSESLIFVAYAQRTNEAFEVSAELKAVLLESIAKCERGETIPPEQLFQEMFNRESAARAVPVGEAA